MVVIIMFYQICSEKNMKMLLLIRPISHLSAMILNVYFSYLLYFIFILSFQIVSFPIP